MLESDYTVARYVSVMPRDMMESLFTPTPTRSCRMQHGQRSATTGPAS